MRSSKGVKAMDRDALIDLIAKEGDLTGDAAANRILDAIAPAIRAAARREVLLSLESIIGHAPTSEECGHRFIEVTAVLDVINALMDDPPPTP
jgi:hypothetical protein